MDARRQQVDKGRKILPHLKLAEPPMVDPLPIQYRVLIRFSEMLASVVLFITTAVEFLERGPQKRPKGRYADSQKGR
jgi:hypothetical protein